MRNPHRHRVNTDTNRILEEEYYHPLDTWYTLNWGVEDDAYDDLRTYSPWYGIDDNDY